LVTALPIGAKADPTRKNFRVKTVYDIAGDGAMRDAFRSACHTLGDPAISWDPVTFLLL
jgi:hypothetical protein